MNYIESKIEITSLSLILSLVFFLSWLFALIYAIPYLKGRGKRERGEDYLFYLILFLSALGLLFFDNLLLLFLFWEVASFSAWRLVLSYKGEREKVAANWTFILNFLGGVLLLLGIVSLYFEKGTISLFELKGLGEPILLTSLFILGGILVKSALLPFYIWLPYAYEAAPIPSCAILSGLAESMGPVLFLRVFLLNINMGKDFYFLTGVIGITSAIFAGGLAYFARGRRLLAYSTISQLGFILFGLSLSLVGMVGSLLLLVSHSLAKPGLFFLLGEKEEGRGADFFSFGLLALSLIGLPPFLGFFGKLFVIIGAIERNFTFGISAILASIFTLLYILKLANQLKPIRGKIRFAGIPLLIGIILLMCGLATSYLYRILESGL